MAPGNKADAAKSEEAVKRWARTRCHSSASAQIFPVAPATRAPTAAGVPPAGQPPRAAPGTAHASRIGAAISAPRTSIQLVQFPGSGFCWLPGERSVDQGVSCESGSRGLENCSSSSATPSDLLPSVLPPAADLPALHARRPRPATAVASTDAIATAATNTAASSAAAAGRHPSS
ncbi:hypothetical protein C2845_PM12G06680 [Panicum miliaceum]|uniref:Uncharacterized protein n=1 Tax=Panicum miliaceum TaxID=4540 RepID=A0A3L6QD39_PANMI|nr:hypothetical protein C2845_PM12G06680 [Panicum miliaceum]